MCNVIFRLGNPEPRIAIAFCNGRKFQVNTRIACIAAVGSEFRRTASHPVGHGSRRSQRLFSAISAVKKEGQTGEDAEKTCSPWRDIVDFYAFCAAKAADHTRPQVVPARRVQTLVRRDE